MLDGMPMAIGAPHSASQDNGSPKALGLEQNGRLSQGNTADARPSDSLVEPIPQAPLEFRDSAVNRASSTPAAEHSNLNPESAYPAGRHQESAQPTDPLSSLKTSSGAVQSDAALQASPSLPDGGLPAGTMNLQAFLDSYSALKPETGKAESSAYRVSDPNGSTNAPATNGDGKDSSKPPPSIPLQNVASLPNVPFIPAASISHPLPNIPPPLASRRGNASSHAPTPASSASARDDGAFTPEMERAFEEFLREESANVSEGSWEKFPDGSRLFIGERYNSCEVTPLLILQGIYLPRRSASETSFKNSLAMANWPKYRSSRRMASCSS
jgi:hypothetical protein